MNRAKSRRAWRIALAAGLSAAWILGAGVERAAAQAMIADDVIVLSKGQRARAKARMGAVPDALPGSGASLLPPSPGTAAGLASGAMRGRQAAPTSGASGVLSAASGYSTAFSGRAEQPQIAPLPAQPVPSLPQYGTLDLPKTEDEGPADGLTLDAAIDRLVRVNPELRAKFGEIPKAQADVLTAGLIANPIIFASADSVPYGQYSPQRPGNNSYGIVLIQPIDINGKRRVRMIAAEQAKRVVEAQYQDEVRLAIDRLYTAFVDVLEARENVRYKEANLTRLVELARASETLYRRSNRPRAEFDRAAILRDSAEVELDAARTTHRQARQSLAALLHINPGAPDLPDVRGAIKDSTPPPPPAEDLVGLACVNRPDLVAYRLGVQRARAEVRLMKAERFEDVFLFYTPYGFNNYAYEHDKSATSWSLGGMVSIPLFNRNQGNIARANHVVTQTEAALHNQELQAATEVQRAYLDYEATRGAVKRLEKDILPRARRYRDDQYRLYVAGEQDVNAYYNAERDYNDVVRQYRDTLIRHRRSMLKLNTMVGQRILP